MREYLYADGEIFEGGAKVGSVKWSSSIEVSGPASLILQPARGGYFIYENSEVVGSSKGFVVDYKGERFRLSSKVRAFLTEGSSLEVKKGKEVIGSVRKDVLGLSFSCYDPAYFPVLIAYLPFLGKLENVQEERAVAARSPGGRLYVALYAGLVGLAALFAALWSWSSGLDYPVRAPMAVRANSYLFMSLTFAFAVAAYLERRLSNGKARSRRPSRLALYVLAVTRTISGVGRLL